MVFVAPGWLAALLISAELVPVAVAEQRIPKPSLAVCLARAQADGPAGSGGHMVTRKAEGRAGGNRDTVWASSA